MENNIKELLCVTNIIKEKQRFESGNKVNFAMNISLGDTETFYLVMQLLSDSKMSDALTICESMNIKGRMLYNLYCFSCNKDQNNFLQTIHYLKNGLYSKNEIDLNLSLENPIPFIDESINFKESVTEIPNTFNLYEANLFEFCDDQRKLFNNRINAIVVAENKK